MFFYQRLLRHLPHTFVLLVGMCIAATGPTIAQNVVLSGDTTPSFAMSEARPQSLNIGNTTFFSNVLGSGTQVVVLDTTNTGAKSEINNFYGSLAGVTSSVTEGQITPETLAGADLLVVVAPDDSLMASEVAAIAAFRKRGGDLFLLGESTVIPYGPSSNAVINDLLNDLNVPLSLTSDAFDSGNQTATAIAMQIESNALTAGVTSFSYGATTLVNGGQPLFLASNGQAFVATIPEPSVFVLLILGGYLLLVQRRTVSVRLTTAYS